MGRESYELKTDESRSIPNRVKRLFSTQCTSNFFEKGNTGSYGLHVEKQQLSVTLKRLNYCVIFIVYTQFTNVAVDRLIQAVQLRVGNPLSKPGLRNLWHAYPRWKPERSL
jgi:hypothetical protein